MEVDVYRVVNNSHMAHSLLAYVPRDKLVAEGDLIDEGWDLNWWSNTYPDSVKYWKLDVDRDLPVHGNIHTYPEVLAYIKKQEASTVQFCATQRPHMQTSRDAPSPILFEADHRRGMARCRAGRCRPGRPARAACPGREIWPPAAAIGDYRLAVFNRSRSAPSRVNRVAATSSPS